MSFQLFCERSAPRAARAVAPVDNARLASVTLSTTGNRLWSLAARERRQRHRKRGALPVRRAAHNSNSKVSWKRRQAAPGPRLSRLERARWSWTRIQRRRARLQYNRGGTKVPTCRR
jgi:hypothetical protein